MNNFDQSSSGINLELSCFWDQDISSFNFKEDYQNDDSIPDLWHYISFGTFAVTDVTDINNYKDVTRQAVMEALKDNSIYGNIFHDFCARYEVAPSKATKRDMLEYLSDSLSYKELFSVFCENFTPKFYIAKTNGNNQGDYFKAIIPEQAIIDCPTMTHDMWDDMIYKDCYCAPLYCRLNIDDEEFYFDSYLSDQYNYDKAEIMAIAEKHIEHEQKGYILQWLDSALPEYPDYQ